MHLTSTSLLSEFLFQIQSIVSRSSLQLNQNDCGYYVYV